jgi:Bacterial toxin 3/Domain of unknown function (DUF4157)
MRSKIAADRPTGLANQDSGGRKRPGKPKANRDAPEAASSAGHGQGAKSEPGPAQRAGDWEMTSDLSAALGLSVQARGDLDRTSPQEAHATAAAGVSGTGSSLPHLDQVQRAFGAHSLDGVRAHVGGEAAAASGTLGAEAYALGDNIAFKQQPDLHTAAHEAAHVVQQRAGVQLQGGLGQKGDAYEQNADAVADAVVAGRSAEPLLGAAPSSAAASPASAPAIQRQETPPTAAEDVPTRARRYAQRVRDALAATTLLIFSTPDGNAVRGALSQPPEVVRAMRDLYDAEFNTLSGRGLSADLIERFGVEDLEYMSMLMLRAGLDCPPAAVTLRRQQAAATAPGAAIEPHITASPQVASAPPGSSITYAVERGPEASAPGSYYSYQWSCINDPLTRDQYGGQVRFDGPWTQTWNATWDIPGDHTIICRVQFHPEGACAPPAEFLEYRQNVRPIGEINAEAFATAESSDFVRFRAGLEMHTLDLTQNGVPDQNFGGTHITTSGPNPAVPGTPPNLAYHSYTVAPIPGATRFRWYVYCDDMENMATEHYHGFARIEVNGRAAYDLGTGESARFIIDRANVYTLHCEQRGDDNQFLGSATYRQVVHSQEAQDIANNWTAYTGRVDQQIQTIDATRRVGIRASYVSGENGAVMSPTFFIGPDAAQPGRIKFLDLTPGISRAEYGGADVEGALSDFQSGNSYPRGHITFEIPANDAGIPASTRVLETDGSSDFASWAAGLGWASLGLAVAGIAATVIPGGQVFAPALFIAAAGVGTVSSGLSIYDQLQQSQVSGTSIAIDVLGIASNIIGAGVAFRAARAGTAVAITGRARMLLWAGASLDVSSGILLTIDGFDQIARVLDDTAMPEGEKISAVVRILAALAVNGGLIALSVREAGDTSPTPHTTGGDPALPGTTSALPNAATALPDASAARSRISGLLGDAASGLSDDLARGLDTLSDTSLGRLTSATPEQLTRIAEIAAINPAGANHLIGVVGADLSLHSIANAGGGQIRINDQLDIHPSALANIPADDLRVILEATRTGNQTALLPYTRSGSLRLRFRFQLDGTDTFIDDLLTRAGLAADDPRRALFSAMDDASRARLNDINRGGWTLPELPNRAALHALAQSPTTVRAFVEHFEMFVAEFDRLARARTAGTPRAEFNATVLARMTPEYMATRNAELLGQLDGRVGATSLGSAELPDAELVPRIRAIPDVHFGADTAATYHANKHHHELPTSHQATGSDIVPAYLNSANLTIQQGTHTINVVQNGSRQIVFTHTYPSADGPRTMLARVFVTAEGNVVLATYGMVSPR